VELLEAAGAGHLPTTSELTQALLTEGPEGGTRWLLMLDERRQGRELLFPEDAPEVLDAKVLDALERLTTTVPDEVLARLGEIEEIDARHSAARVALDLLAHCGEGPDLRLACELASPHPDAKQSDHSRVGRDLAAAVTAILERDPSGYGIVESLYGAGHPWLDWNLVRGLGGTKTLAALKVLPRLLGAVPQWDASVLSKIGDVARMVQTPLDDASLNRIRMYLTSTLAEERKYAAFALGRLDDYDSLDDLIGLLSDDDRGVRANSYWALRGITAMTINSEPRRWRLWYDGETQWWREQGGELLARLADEDLAEVCLAINECGTKRLFRRQLTPELVPLLRHSDPTVVRLTCSALHSLRALDANQALIEVLEHPQIDVRLKAAEVLAGLTGEQGLPAEPEPWRERLSQPRPQAR